MKHLKLFEGYFDEFEVGDIVIYKGNFKNHQLEKAQIIKCRGRNHYDIKFENDEIWYCHGSFLSLIEEIDMVEDERDIEF